MSSLIVSNLGALPRERSPLRPVGSHGREDLREHPGGHRVPSTKKWRTGPPEDKSWRVNPPKGESRRASLMPP